MRGHPALPPASTLCPYLWQTALPWPARGHQLHTLMGGGFWGRLQLQRGFQGPRHLQNMKRSGRDWLLLGMAPWVPHSLEEGYACRGSRARPFKHGNQNRAPSCLGLRALLVGDRRLRISSCEFPGPWGISSAHSTLILWKQTS